MQRGSKANSSGNFELEMEASSIKNRILPASATDIRTTIKTHTTNNTTITTTTTTTTTITSASTMTTRFAANIIPNCSRYRSYNLNRSLKCLSAVRWNTHNAKFLNFLHKTEEQSLYTQEFNDKSIILYRYRSIGIIQNVANCGCCCAWCWKFDETNWKPKTEKKSTEKYLQFIIIELFIVFNFFLDLNIAYISKYIYNIWFLFCISCHEPQNYKSSFNLI